MRAALFREPGAPLEVREIELDGPGPRDVVVRMVAVGVCGSDLHVVRGEWRRPVPMILGHEGAGVVESVGSEVASVQAGDAVVLSWAPVCGACAACRRGRRTACLPLREAIGKGTMPDGTTHLRIGDETVYRMTTVGALAELVLAPEAAVLPLPAGIPLEQAALLGCAALTGVGAVRNSGRVGPGSSVVVIGAGGVGQFCVQGARLAGAATIVAAAFEAVGSASTAEVALALARPGGYACLVGMPAGGTRLDLDPFELVNREKLLTGSAYGSEDPSVALPRLLEDVADGGLRLSPLVGPSYPLERADDAIQAPSPPRRRGSW